MEIIACVNRTPVTGDIEAVHNKRKINLFGCGLRHTVAEAPIEANFNIKMNITTPYMPITSDGKEPTARDDGPSSEEVREYAFGYVKQFSKKNMSDRPIASQLASSTIWLEKVQLVCPSYYYVMRRARYDYLLRQGTWAMMFGPGKTSTSILNEASAKLGFSHSRGVSKCIFHALPDMARNFYAVSAWPRHERNLVMPDFATYSRDCIAECQDRFWIPCGGSRFEF